MKNLSEILQTAKKHARDNLKNYPRACFRALQESGFRPGQQWGVTRNLRMDIPGIQPDDRETLLSILTMCLGREGGLAAAASRKEKADQLQFVL